MNLRIFLSALFICVCAGAAAQSYTVGTNAHSHNDYLRERPFHDAYSNRFASMEIDVFLVDGKLMVAHTPSEITGSRTIETLYLDPLMERIRLGGGKVYPDGGKLQFLIDLKTSGEATLRALEELLKPMRSYFDAEQNPGAVRLVISGSMPSPEKFDEYDRIFWFDGRAGTDYTDRQLERVAFYSASFTDYSRWRGTGSIPEEEYRRLRDFVDFAHGSGKKVRFWGCPDTETAWKTFIELGVDYLNTDNPSGLADFLERIARD